MGEARVSVSSSLFARACAADLCTHLRIIALGAKLIAITPRPLDTHQWPQSGRDWSIVLRPIDAHTAPLPRTFVGSELAERRLYASLHRLRVDLYLSRELTSALSVTQHQKNLLFGPVERDRRFLSSSTLQLCRRPLKGSVRHLDRLEYAGRWRIHIDD